MILTDFNIDFFVYVWKFFYVVLHVNREDNHRLLAYQIGSWWSISDTEHLVSDTRISWSGWTRPRGRWTIATRGWGKSTSPSRTTSSSSEPSESKIDFRYILKRCHINLNMKFNIWFYIISILTFAILLSHVSISYFQKKKL